MKKTYYLLALVVVLCVRNIKAETVYSNADTDTLSTLFAAVNTFDQVHPWTAIGDQITLAGTARSAQAASVQYFGMGAGTFDATLRFFEVGTPAGAQIGGPFTVTGIALSNFDIGTITFPLGGLVLPDNLIFMVSVGNQTPGVDVGFNQFDPPTIGSSDHDFFVAEDINGFGIATTGVPGLTPRIDNLYFTLVAVPEPSALTIGLFGITALFTRRSIRRRNANPRHCP